MGSPQTKPDTLRLVVGATAIAAPVLHCITDAMEWLQGGFSPVQLGLNYFAFLPMPWLLLCIYAVRADHRSGTSTGMALRPRGAAGTAALPIAVALRVSLATFGSYRWF